MRFNVEKTFLKQESDSPNVVSHRSLFSQTEADDVGEALHHLIARSHAELVDEVHYLPGSQAVTAVREGSNVFMLQLFPAGEDWDSEGDEVRG